MTDFEPGEWQPPPTPEMQRQLDEGEQMKAPADLLWHLPPGVGAKSWFVENGGTGWLMYLRMQQLGLDFTRDEQGTMWALDFTTGERLFPVPAEEVYQLWLYNLRPGREGR